MSLETAKPATNGTVGAGEATTAVTTVAATAGPSNGYAGRAVEGVRSSTPPMLGRGVGDVGAVGGGQPVTPPRQGRIAETNPCRRMEEEEGSGSSGGEGAQEGPMTPMNDAGPFVLDGGHRFARAQ